MQSKIATKFRKNNGQLLRHSDDAVVIRPSYAKTSLNMPLNDRVHDLVVF